MEILIIKFVLLFSVTWLIVIYLSRDKNLSDSKKKGKPISPPDQSEGGKSNDMADTKDTSSPWFELGYLYRFIRLFKLKSKPKAIKKQERAVKMEMPFSFTDTSGHTVPFCLGDTLEFTFRESGGRQVFLRIHCCAFKWAQVETLIEGEESDNCYEIVNSAWLEMHLQDGEIAECDGFKHYNFNFKDRGQFQVLGNMYSIEAMMKGDQYAIRFE